MLCAFPVKGGVLGDQIGYGKTAVTIGLISATKRGPMPIPPVKRNPGRDGRLIPSKATLILSPASSTD